MSADPAQLPPAVRDMRPTDLAAVATIENSVYEFPWTAGIFRDCLLAGYVSLVLEQGGKVVGYGIMSVAAGEAHLLNIALAGDVRGRGYGRYLLDYLGDVAREAGAVSMFLEVRPSNAPALRLYERCGFKLVGRRRGYYRARAGTEDAVILVRRFHRRR